MYKLTFITICILVCQLSFSQNEKIPDGRRDLHVVGLADNTLRWYYQAPNFDIGNTADNWIAYNEDGLMPGTPPVFGDTIYIGPITYAFGSNNVPFEGTIGRIELVGETP